jgi:hypothetical protein
MMERQLALYSCGYQLVYGQGSWAYHKPQVHNYYI